MTDPDTERGLYSKYVIYRPDGEYVDDPCFVLNFARDPHARAAIAAYADSCEADYQHLAADLRARYLN